MMAPFFPVLISLVSSTPSSFPIFNSQSRLASFYQWANEQGIDSRATVGGGDLRGLIALERIEAGEIVIRVPLSATLRVIGDTSDNDEWAGVLASRLLIEAKLGNFSNFAPYLSAGLPNEAPVTPCQWNDMELNQLENSTFVMQVQNNSRWRHEQLNRHLGNESDYATLFLTMLDLVCSRTLMGRDDHSRQLVPFIDIANHAPWEAGGGEFKVGSDAVYLLAGHYGFDAGQEVTMDYGARTVEDFLLHYGFVPDRCSSDSVMIADQCTSWKDCSYHGHVDENVRMSAVKLLDSYSMTLEEDLALLNSENNNASKAYSLALQYRLAKKSLISIVAGLAMYQ